MSKQIITIIVVALIFFGLGFFVAGIIYKGTASNQSGFQDGWDAAKQRLVEKGYAPATEGVEITSVGGEVKQVEGDTIVLDIYPLEILSDPELDERIVLVTENTKIYQLKEKNPEQYQKELEELNGKTEEQAIDNADVVGEPPIYPEMFEKMEASLSDIKLGQHIVAVALENIHDIKKFEATEIIIQALEPVGLF